MIKGRITQMSNYTLTTFDCQNYTMKIIQLLCNIINKCLHMKYSILLIFTCFIGSITFAASNLFPADSITSKKDKKAAVKFVKEGQLFFEGGKVKDALNRFREAAVKDPNAWEPLFWIGKCHYNLNNYGLTLKYEKDALNLNKQKNKNELYEYIGLAFHRTNLLDSALYYFDLVKKSSTEKEFNYTTIASEIAQCEFAKKEVSTGKKSLKKGLKDVNSGYNDYAPIFTDQGKTLYITSRRPDTKGGLMNPDDQEYFEDIYRAVWNETNQTWDSLSNELDRINSNGFDAFSCIYANGTKGLITINNTAIDLKNQTKSSDLFTVELSSKQKWSTPKRIDDNSINTSFFEGSASMTDDGNTLYFVSDRNAETSSSDIFVSTKINGEWSKPKALPASINSLENETTPFISSDGRFLFFSSNGLLGMGGYDVFVVENLGSTWGTPINLGSEVNSVNNDTHFQYYPQLKKAVLSSFEIIGQKSSMDVYELDFSTFKIPTAK